MLQKQIDKITQKYSPEEAVAKLIIQTVVNYYMINSLAVEQYERLYLSYLKNVLLKSKIKEVNFERMYKKRHGIFQNIISIITEDSVHNNELLSSPYATEVSSIMEILFKKEVLKELF